MQKSKRVLILFVGLLLSILSVTPSLAAEGIKVRMKVDGMI